MALNRQGNQADANKQCQAGVDAGPNAEMEAKIREECAERLPAR